MKDYLEPYIKENNVIQLSLFYFSDRKLSSRVVEWSDNDGEYKLKITCDYGIPGSLEHDIYTVIMKMWLKQGTENPRITLNYSDIARELGLQPNSWVTKIKKSLRRLGSTRYEFEECFVKADENGNNKITTFFSLFDTVHLYESSKKKSRRNSKSELVFPNDIVRNVQANYYQLLDMIWYRKLPDGLARRLYEFLAKKYYLRKDNIFKISEEAICRWLPITDKNTTKRKKLLEKTANDLILSSFLKSYRFDKKNKVCFFEYREDIRAKRSNIDNQKDFDNIMLDDPMPIVSNAKTIVLDKNTEDIYKNTEICKLFSEVKNLTNSVKKMIIKYYNDKNFDYVLWNIRYANANANKRYSAYLSKSLSENWGLDLKEEETQKIVNKKLLNQEEQYEYEEKSKKEIQIKKERELFQKEYEKFSEEEKRNMFLEAEKSINKDIIGRTMLVKIEYIQLIREKLSKIGFEFCGESISGLNFVKKITKNINKN